MQYITTLYIQFPSQFAIVTKASENMLQKKLTTNLYTSPQVLQLVVSPS